MTDNSFQYHRRQFLRQMIMGAAVGVSVGFPIDALAANRRRLPLSKSAVRRNKIIMIDPGHGGHDPGAVGKGGTYEKDVTLDIARRLAKHINSKRGLEAQLTRNSDNFLPLGERVKLGREAKADFFISIHADSAPNTDARGLSVYTLSEKGTDQFARMIAEKENEADKIAGVDLGSTNADVAAILVDLATRHARDVALKARSHLVHGVDGDLDLLKNPMRAANFAVLRAPDVPSILVETGFFSNMTDERLLRNTTHRQRIASVLGREIGEFIASGKA